MYKTWRYLPLPYMDLRVIPVGLQYPWLVGTNMADTNIATLSSKQNAYFLSNNLQNTNSNIMN